jgi:hypothetical protein
LVSNTYLHEFNFIWIFIKLKVENRIGLRLKYLLKMKPIFVYNPRLNRNRLSSNPAAVPYLEQYPDEIHWPMLSLNPDAIHLLAQHPDKIHWYSLSKNPNALPILEQHMDKVVWETIAFNPNVIRILDPNPNLPLTWSPKTHTSMDELVWSWLCRNEGAVPFLEKHMDHIHWDNLSFNPGAIHLLEENLDKINWDYLSENPNAIHLLEKNLDKIDWHRLCRNPQAMHILELRLEQNPQEGLDWSYLSREPYAVPILEKHLDKVNWASMCFNPGAIHLLEQNLDKVYWGNLSVNTGAVELFSKNMDRYNRKDTPVVHLDLDTETEPISMEWMSFNENAVHILEQHPDEINWDYLSQNKGAGRLLCKLDLAKMRENALSLKEELTAYLFDPDRMARMARSTGLDMRTYLMHF